MKRALAEASLIMKPEGGANELLPSLKPIDGSGDFTFSRGADLAATRVNSDGLIEKYRENLLTYSNDFSNSSWAKYQGSSVTSGQADKDGGTNAWKLNVVSSQSFSGLFKSISGSSVCTMSIYAKAGTLDRLGIVNMSGAGFAVWFDLTNGTIGTQGSSNIDAKIEAVGTDGWYRVSFTQLLTSGDYFQLKPSDGETTPSGADGFIYIMNAQAETGLVATDYLDSGATTAKAGVLIDLPRINYDANGENGALLLEPSRTNLIEYSEYLGGWQVPASYTNTTTTDKQGFEIKSIYDRVFYKTTTINSGSTYSLSFYAKKDTWDFINIQTSGWDSSANGYTWFNLATGNVGTSSSNHGTPTMTPEGDGWYRCTIYFSSTTDLTGNIVITPVESNGSYTRGVNDQEAAFLTMVQWEQGSYPTSYIPNHGTSGGVTRAADSCSVTGVSDVIGQTEGTMFAQVGEFPKEYNGRILGISDGTTSNYVIIIKNTTNTDFAVYAVKAGTAQATYLGTGSLNDNSKIAVGYANNDYVVYVNGTQVHTDTSASVPTCDDVWIGQRENGSVTYIAGGSLKQATLFNERLTNEELATLTTL